MSVDLPQFIYGRRARTTWQGATDGRLLLDGASLSVEALLSIAAYKHGAARPPLQLDLTDEAWTRVRRARAVVDRVLREQRTVYGINTGFGNFATTVIAPAQLEQLQYNLITSHAAGVGEPMSLERALSLMVLRINTLAKGHSGIRPETLAHMIRAFNAHCVPWIPEQGSVGASGDLAPLAHLACGLIGVGKMWDAERNDWAPATEVLAKHGLAPIRLGAKEGLSMINGTQFITSLAAEAIGRIETLVRVADIVAAFTLEALQGTHRAFDPKIHAARPHSGQQLCAQRVRALLHTEQWPSAIYQAHVNCHRVQDSYTLRCIPQVHGVVVDTLRFVRDLIETEMNSDNDKDDGTGEILSGGNFHGEYPAKALDYLAIAVHELASISERRIERLVNPTLSELPAFLTPEGGLNSGFMIAHVTAAALVSENKTLCHPASVDSISTSAAKEDHVSMGAWAARKCLKVVRNVENVIGVELLCACQALEFLRPLKTTEPLERVHAALRAVVEPWKTDRFMSPDIEAACTLVKSGELLDLVRDQWRHIEQPQSAMQRQGVAAAAATATAAAAAD